MTTPKIDTVKVNDQRLYLWDGQRVPSVTTIIGMTPKEFLQYWAANKVAEAAIQKGTVTQNDYRWLKSAPNRDRDKAAQIGSNVHDTLDRLVNLDDGEEIEIPPEEVPFVDGFYQFRDRFNPEFIRTEETVLGEIDGHGYAGSFDALIKMNDENWLIDFKTTRSGVHAEVALQLAAYAHAQKIIHPDGTDEPMLPVDKFGVLWLRPDQWKFVEINVSEELLDTFSGLLKTWHYENFWKKKAIGAILASGKYTDEPF